MSPSTLSSVANVIQTVAIYFDGCAAATAGLSGAAVTRITDDAGLVVTVAQLVARQASDTVRIVAYDTRIARLPTWLTNLRDLLAIRLRIGQAQRHGRPTRTGG